MFGILADKLLPKTDHWLHSAVNYAVGELRRPHEGGVSFLDHFLKSGKTPGDIAALVLVHIGDDLSKLLKPERKGDLRLSVHYYPAPNPMLSVQMQLIERDHIYPDVFERFALDFAPPPFEMIEVPVAPPPVKVKPAVQTKTAPARGEGRKS